jgi:ELWxxDGT repeat protein
MKKVAIYLILTISTINICFSQMSMVKDINYHTKNSIKRILANVGNDVFFTAEWVDTTTFENKKALWITDGTTQNTRIFSTKKINDRFYGYSEIEDENSIKDYIGTDSLMFCESERDSVLSNGQKIIIPGVYKFNKINSEPIKLYDIKVDNNPYPVDFVKDYTKSGNFIYFSAYSYYSTAQVPYKELVRSDGTKSGTFRLKESGTNGRILKNPSSLRENQGVLYFIANSREIWKTEGNNSNTTLLYDFVALGDSLTPYQIICTQTKLIVNVFSVRTYKYYFLTVNYNLSNACYYKVPNYVSNPNSSKTSDIFFYIDYRVVMRSDGTTLGTFPVQQFSQTPNIYNKFLHNNVFYFLAANPSNPRPGDFNDDELWRSDGTTTGTYLLKDVNPNTHIELVKPWSSRINTFFNFKNELYFFANGDGEGYELWKTDGTSNGTVIVKNADLLLPNEAMLDSYTKSIAYQNNEFRI